MKKQVVFIGGGDSYSNYDDYILALQSALVRNPLGEATPRWTDSLRENLGEGYELYMIPMPNTDNAKYEEWKIWFEKYFEYFRDDVVLVGWSLGGMFLAKYLAENPPTFRLGGLFLLAAPCGSYDDGSGNDCGSFQFDIQLLASSMGSGEGITIMHSTDDFVVSYEAALKYSEMLPGAELITFTDKTHFLVEELPELVERIKRLG